MAFLSVFLVMKEYDD